MEEENQKKKKQQLKEGEQDHLSLAHSPLDEQTENRILESVSEGMINGDIDGI